MKKKDEEETDVKKKGEEETGGRRLEEKVLRQRIQSASFGFCPRPVLSEGCELSK